MDQNFFSRRVAVTGATGMIGSHLVAEMVRTGYTDIVLPVRSTARINNLRRTFDFTGTVWPDENVFTVIETDLTDADSLAGAFDGVDTVFNCAGRIMTGEISEQQLIDNNVSIARGIAEAAVKAGVRHIIHTSSIVVLAPNESLERLIDETCRAHGDAHGSAYARSKFLADVEIRSAAGENVKVTTLYPAVVLGEGDWSLNGSSAMIPFISKGLPVYTNGAMAYVDVRDLARAYLAIDAYPEAAGDCFIVSGDNLTYRELFELGAKTAGRPKPFIKVGRGFATFGYGVIRFLTAAGLMKDRSVTKSNLDSVLTGNRYDGSKLARICRFEYTPMPETVDRVVKAYLDRDKKRG